MITDALIRGTSYAIDDKYSSEQIKSALDLEGVNLTMIPAPTVDGRLMLQCTHSATLLAALFEYVFQDEIGEKGGGFYISRMFPLVSMGIGIKFSLTGHMIHGEQLDPILLLTTQLPHFNEISCRSHQVII